MRFKLKERETGNERMRNEATSYLIVKKLRKKSRGSQGRTKSSRHHFAVFFILARARHTSGKWISHKALYWAKLNISAKYAKRDVPAFSFIYFPARLLTKNQQLDRILKLNTR